MCNDGDDDDDDGEGYHYTRVVITNEKYDPYHDHDDDGEGYHYTRVVITNESYNEEKYDPYHAILNNGANITIIKDVQLVTNIRRTKHKHDVITIILNILS